MWALEGRQEAGDKAVEGCGGLWRTMLIEVENQA